MNSLKEQIDNLEANSVKDIKKLFPFVVTINYKYWSDWHDKKITYTDYGYKKIDQICWFSRRTNNLSDSWDYDEIILILNTLKKSNFRYACNYCCRGTLGSANKFTDPIEFLNWVEKNNYSFEKFSQILEINKGYWQFCGNLKEYSCAFTFYIFDEKLVKEISSRSGVKIK